MSKDPNQLNFDAPIKDVEPVTSRNFGHTVVHLDEVPDDFENYHHTHNAVEIRRMLGEAAVSAPNTTPPQATPSKQSKYPRSRKGLNASGLRIADRTSYSDRQDEWRRT